MHRSIPVALVLLASAVVLVPATPAQTTDPSGFKFCNAPGFEDLVLVFLNPDLRIRDDGLVHASGQFFIQFQARGEKALEIETLKFSFGKPVPGLQVCDPQAPQLGMPITEAAYLKNYRSDNDWRDGFFIPINTYNVPDGVYAAAISVYNADGVEMVRGWTNALVENGGRRTGFDGCDNVPKFPPPSTFYCPDFTAPWPMILPGDGERLDGGSGLYIEVAEDVSDIKVYINGRLAQLNNATAPQRDDDVAPDLGYGPLYKNPAADGQLKKKVWGPAWTWDGLIQTEDVVKVVVTDLWGNVAEKVVHIGDPTIGGRVSAGAPEFDILIDEPTQSTDANGRAVFNVTYRIKKDFLHGNVFVRHASGKLPDGITARLNPNHVMEGARNNEPVDVRGTVTFMAGPTAPTGAQDFDLVVEYLQGTEHVSKHAKLKLLVADRGNGTADDPIADRFGNNPTENIRGAGAQNNQTGDAGTRNDEGGGFLGIPAPAPAAGLLAVLGAAMLLVRCAGRRRG